MVRKQIYFSQRQVKLLTQEAEKQQTNFSEFVRRILDGYLEAKELPAHGQSPISGGN